VTFLAELKAQARFCFDTETTAINPLEADLVGLSFCWQAGEAYYLPVRAPAGSPTLDEKALLDALRPVLADPAVEKIGQNVKYDMLVLQRAGSHGRRAGNGHDGSQLSARKWRTQPQPRPASPSACSTT